MGHKKQWLWYLGIGWMVCFPVPTVAQVVELDQGFVRGLSESRVHVYKGIPFAAPPIGPLRWQPPQPLPAWEDTLNADTFSAGCIQDVVGSRPPWTEEFMHQGEVSEDCLYLNVWTQAAYSERPKPVLVYIHGGGFQEGSGSVAVYDGSSLAQNGLVVVTINYRLGILGFFAHPDLSADSPHQASGNYGILDQVAALQWVKDNIAAFGGDPENVTVAGQSAGAMSVFLLTSSPLAKGLFQRVIVQSGPGGLASFGLTDLRSVAIPLSDAEEAGREYVANHNLQSVQEMRMITTNELSSLPSVRFFPVIDGNLLTGDVSTIYDRGLQHQVSVMMGFNADEGSAFPGMVKLLLRSIASLRMSAMRMMGICSYPCILRTPIRLLELHTRTVCVTWRQLRWNGWPRPIPAHRAKRSTSTTLNERFPGRSAPNLAHFTLLRYHIFLAHWIILTVH